MLLTRLPLHIIWPFKKKNKKTKTKHFLFQLFPTQTACRDYPLYMRVDKYGPPHILQLSVKTHIAYRAHSKAKLQLHSTTALKTGLPAPEDDKVATPLRNSTFIIPSKANPAMRCHQVFSGELSVLLQSEL